MCYLHLLCRQWSYLRLWLSRKAGTGAAPASGPVFSGPATRRTLLGDNCCSQLKIVSTPARTTNPGTLTVTRSRVTNPRVSWQHPCSCRIQTPAAAGGGVATLTPVSGPRDTATPTEWAEPAATPEPELDREEESWQRNFAELFSFHNIRR